MRYTKAFSTIAGITVQQEAPSARSIYWMYTVLVNEEAFGMDSRALMRALKEKGVESRPLWHPLHSLKPFKECTAHKIVVADSLYREGLSLPCSVGLTLGEQESVIQLINNLSKGAL